MVNFQDRFFSMIDPAGNKHRLIILPQKIAEESFNGKVKLEKPTALISIVCKEDEPAKFKRQKNLWLWRMKFDDVGAPITPNSPHEKDFVGLRHFVEEVRDFFCITIHCWQGLSRSAGVALAICEYLGWMVDGSEGEFYDDLVNRDFIPNMWVYRLADHELRKGEK